MFRLTMRTCQQLHCKLCGEWIDPDRVQETAAKAALVGSATYAICPVCKQEVTDKDNPKWRKKVDKHYAKKGGK